ncbi:cold shock domain-containing protein (plasmid) [Streptomyces sp. BI20]|uniref:cold shock domain-containing protein n=1 Tax=Streptomyces sp. BI20 TaxID=3403460 RepID=UPI003C71A287
MAERVGGVVVWFNQSKGYGYVRGDGGDEVRVRREDLDDATFLTEGLRVTFLVVASEEGEARAVHVRIVAHGRG